VRQTVVLRMHVSLLGRNCQKKCVWKSYERVDNEICAKYGQSWCFEWIISSWSK